MNYLRTTVTTPVTFSLESSSQVDLGSGCGYVEVVSGCLNACMLGGLLC
jgi:hypothetical protein